MTETAMRDLMRQAMSGDEPPMGPVLGKALHAARRAKRQRLAGSMAAAALTAVSLAAGVSVVGGLWNGLQRTDASTQFVFVRPSLPDVTYTRTHSITSEYFGQLLLADLPAGTVHSQVQASAISNIHGAAGRTASASLSDVTTTIGSGTVSAQMTAAGATDTGFGCPPGLAAGHCRAYSLQGGVKVVEQYPAVTLAISRVRVLSFQVRVFRPRVVVISLSESNITAGGTGVSMAMPLTAAQLLTAAIDPRWQFWVTKLEYSGAGSGRGMVM